MKEQRLISEGESRWQSHEFHPLFEEECVCVCYRKFFSCVLVNVKEGRGY